MTSKELTKVEERPVIRGKISHKLDAQMKEKLLQKIGEFIPYAEIRDYFLTEHKISLTLKAIRQYNESEKWKPFIKRYREAYLSNVMDVAGAHKRVRLERQERIYARAMQDGNLSKALEATAQQRVEIEGGPEAQRILLTQNQFYIMSDDELESKKKELIERINQISKPVIEFKPEGE